MTVDELFEQGYSVLNGRVTTIRGTRHNVIYLTKDDELYFTRSNWRAKTWTVPERVFTVRTYTEDGSGYLMNENNKRPMYFAEDDALAKSETLTAAGIYSWAAPA